MRSFRVGAHVGLVMVLGIAVLFAVWLGIFWTLTWLGLPAIAAALIGVGIVLVLGMGISGSVGKWDGLEEKK